MAGITEDRTRFEICVRAPGACVSVHLQNEADRSR